MWDPVAKAHSIVRADEVPIYSEPIAVTMEALRWLPIQLDADVASVVPSSTVPCSRGVDKNQMSSWGETVGRGLRSIAFHSTLAGEVLVCFVYHDERLRMLKRGQTLPDEESDNGGNWVEAAKVLRERLLQS